MWAYEYQEGEAGIHEPENSHLVHAFIHLKETRMSHCQGIGNECLPRRYSWNFSRRVPTVDLMRREVEFEMLIHHDIVARTVRYSRSVNLHSTLSSYYLLTFIQSLILS